ncbi:diaminopimelate epimerase [Sphingomonas vulcanisoli]|uniref:Diaminopimelate epimerase n=1 Tax=Sphingomonas vulcanisoli TaxID=1658060 RepID=A0ABX0TT64_9SPHN|nr:diaminopimelate epimerase [Sphingomonas vulcanisoli]NIJ07339.1 diaminopimelate epimerase [Sphingomonas vulcanisoli]
MLRFHKMHGLGNDFVVIDAREAPVAIDGPRARAIADRRRGIGCDQIVVIEPSDSADAKVRFFNADGSEAESCGNASRCVATLIGGEARVETLGGLLHMSAEGANPSVDMGSPRFDWNQIPIAYPADTAAMPVAWEELEAPMAVNVGNTHAVFFVSDTDAVELDRLGPIIEHDPIFPNRTNVNVATIENPDRIRLRVWERGTGLTEACGTGACATAVAAIKQGKAHSPVTVALPGGELVIEWAPGGPIRMTGPATYVYSGEADL